MQIEDWVEEYRRVWEDADVAGAGDLFTPDATYQTTPFETPLRGRDAIEDYWRRATGSQDERSITCRWLGSGPEEHFVHFRAELVRGGAPRTVDGVLAVRFDDAGLCTALREWWHSTAAE